MRRIGVGWVECLETEIDRGFGPFPADLGSLEGKILPHREALDLPGIEVHVTRDGAVRKIAGDRLPADARTPDAEGGAGDRSEEHTSELQSLMRNSYAVSCLKKKNKHKLM